MPEKPTRKITAVGLEVDFEGHRKADGEPFTIYAVSAFGEDGQPIDLRLRTFDGDLTLNELIEVTVEHRKDDRHGDTYTIAQVGKKAKTLPESVDELRARVISLESRMAALEGANPGTQSLATPPGGGGGPVF